MFRRTLFVVPFVVVYSLLAFTVLMGANIGLAALNARVTPAVPWFILPGALLLLVAALAAERSVGIGLKNRLAAPFPLVVAIGLAVATLGTAICIAEGSLYGMTHAAELGPPGTSELFQLGYALWLPVVAAVAAELCFRGLMQTGLHALMSPWAAITLTAAINTAAHRWGPDLAQQWLGYFVLLVGFGYLRWWTRSLAPALVAHTLMNLFVSAALYIWGPARWVLS